MRVIATAGHVDHGKSTLVYALTGKDPDRLEEEKRRGLTIDLGFAGFTLPSGEDVAFVDVPGHRRFIGNMLAGLGPAPAVMLVVAADQGWQAQSTEHLDAVNALGLRHGLLILARCGLADPARVAAVRAEALAHIAETSLGEVAVVETDARDGVGIDDLRSALDVLVAGMPPIRPDADVRMWVDRAFTIKGAGTVVTGTLDAGTVRIGDKLDVGGKQAVIRSLEVLDHQRDVVGPVARTAIALRGVAKSDVPRGTPLLTPGTGLTGTVIDVRRETGLSWKNASTDVTVHLGTASVEARVRPLDDAYARLTLAEPLPLIMGDRVIVRDPSAARIHCGATVLDVDPLPLARRGAARDRADTLAAWTAGSASDLVTDRGAVTTAWLQRAGAHGWEEWPEALPSAGFGIVAGWALSAGRVAQWCAALVELVDRDAEDVLSHGIVSAAAADAIGAPRDILPALAQRAGLRVDAGRVVSARHANSMGEATDAVETLRERLTADPFAAPEADDLAALGLGPRQLATAAQRGLLLRLPGDVVLLPAAPALAMRELAGLSQPFTTSQARQVLGTTRRVVIPLLEHLDSRGWTRREGNSRVVVR